MKVDESLERKVRARLLTERGWVEGTLRLPKAVRLVDWLNHGGHFLTLSDVEIGAAALVYVSLRKSAIRVVVPAGAEDVRSVTAAAYRRRARSGACSPTARCAGRSTCSSTSA